MAEAVGLRLGQAVRDNRGRVLLAVGTPITAGLCHALIQRGYRKVYAFDGVADDVTPRDALAERTRVIAGATARVCFQRMEQGGRLPVRALGETVDAILADLAVARNVVLEFVTLRSISDYTFEHSVNVCVYALLIGNALGLAGEELRALGMGALLHDVGKILCADLIAKEGKLSEEDWVRVRQHPVDGFEMLRPHHDLHLYVAHVAYQHHERLDGSGYPRGLVGDKILPVARIVAASDVYDAMTTDRPHARGRPAHVAMDVLRQGAGTLFDERVVQAFSQRVAVYPAGTPVLLADGTVAVVAGQGAIPGEPLVRLLGRAGEPYADQREVAARGEAAVLQVLDHWPSWLEAVLQR